MFDRIQSNWEPNSIDCDHSFSSCVSVFTLFLEAFWNTLKRFQLRKGCSSNVPGEQPGVPLHDLSPPCVGCAFVSTHDADRAIPQWCHRGAVAQAAGCAYPGGEAMLSPSPFIQSTCRGSRRSVSSMVWIWFGFHVLRAKACPFPVWFGGRLR